MEFGDLTFQLGRDSAEIYEQVLVPLWFGRWARSLIDILSLQPSENVLDVACGTGVTTRMAHELIGSTGHIDGLDINPSMLAKAKELADGLDINWIERDVCASGLPANTYDVIMSQHGYHYFPDKHGALRHFRHLLKPGGRMAFSVWVGHSAYTEALCAAVERYISPDIANKQRAQRLTATASELARQVSDAGFSRVNVLRQELMISVPLAPEFVPLHLASMPIAAAFQALSDDSKNALIQDVEEALAAHIKGKQIVYADAVHVAIGYK